MTGEGDGNESDGESDGDHATPGDEGAVARLRGMLATTRGKATAGAGAAVVLVAAVLLVATAGGDDPAPAPATTTTTATTAPPPPPPVYPLTGLPVTDPEAAARPSLVVKIDNAEPDARPQIGLVQADVVYEERVEGAVTRFLAVFHSQDAVPVGPVRSARTSDIGLFSPLGTPLFGWSGANPTFAQRIREAGIVDVGYDAVPDIYSRAGDRQGPHDLMLDGTPAAWRVDDPGATAPPQIFAYRADDDDPAGTPTAGVRIVFGTGGGSAPVEYRWDGSGWARSQAGTPHVDAEGDLIAPENVIVSYTPYAASDTNDQFGVPIREAQLEGEGEALVLTAGRAFTARWVKPALDAPTQYLDADGEPIALTPGRTWVALPEPGAATLLP